MVLFNRYYQPDIDLDTLEADRRLHLSTSAELPLRLHALGALHNRVDLSLASSGGVHDGEDAAKAILCGAHAVQMVSALLVDGPHALRRIERELRGVARREGLRPSPRARSTTELSIARTRSATVISSAGRDSQNPPLPPRRLHSSPAWRIEASVAARNLAGRSSAVAISAAVTGRPCARASTMAARRA